MLVERTNGRCVCACVRARTAKSLKKSCSSAAYSSAAVGPDEPELPAGAEELIEVTSDCTASSRSFERSTALTAAGGGPAVPRRPPGRADAGNLRCS